MNDPIKLLFESVTAGDRVRITCVESHGSIGVVRKVVEEGSALVPFVEVEIAGKAICFHPGSVELLSAVDRLGELGVSKVMQACPADQWQRSGRGQPG